MPDRQETGNDRHGGTSVVAEMRRVLDTPPDLAPVTLRGDTRLTRRWRHGALHDALPAMSEHAVMTYYSQPKHIAWQAGGKRVVAATKPGTVTLIPAGVAGRWDIAGGIDVSHVYLTAGRLQSCADVLTDGKPIELLGRVGFEDATTARILELLARKAGIADPSACLFVEQAIVGLSRYRFCTAFRMATDHTPYEWLVRARVERAHKENRRFSVGPIIGATSAGAGLDRRSSTMRVSRDWLRSESRSLRRASRP